MVNRLAVANAFEDLLLFVVPFGWNNDRDVLVQDFIGGVTENTRGTFVPTDNPAPEGFAEDSIFGAFDDGRQPGLGFFGTFSFDELPKLPAESAEQLKKILIGFADFTAETFDDPDDLLTELER